MERTRGFFAAVIMLIAVSPAANADDAILSGTVTSVAGEKLDGVTVSAKPAGGTVTTTVFSDERGDYYFPPLPAGKYRRLSSSSRCRILSGNSRATSCWLRCRRTPIRTSA